MHNRCHVDNAVDNPCATPSPRLYSGNLNRSATWRSERVARVDGVGAERPAKHWRFQSTVPARCGFCAEWIEGAPTHCKWCDEVFVPQPLIGLPVVRETPERAR